MYYSSGNYEAFARPEKPEGIEEKSAYFVGTGLATLSAGCFLIRDGQMPGSHLHFFERDPRAGGGCDGWYYPENGYVMRGGREMDNHFEVMWDLFRSIPSIETDGISVLDEYYWLNKKDPNYSLCRVTENRGEDAHTDGKFGLSDKGCMELMEFFLTPDEELEDKRITDFFDEEVLDSNFWTYWRTMFAFYNCNSALEMKLYMTRFIHHIDGLPDLKALRFTKYNQYESMILPMQKYLEDHGAQFHFNTEVLDVNFEFEGDRKRAISLLLRHDGKVETLDLGKNDYLFMTLGSNVENSSVGGQDKVCEYLPEIQEGGAFGLWRRIAKKDPSFGHPEKFYSHPEECKWMGVTVNTLDDKVLPYIEKITKRDPLSGRVVTGGIVTARDSGWLMSWTINRQPQFHSQPKDQVLVWLYGLTPDEKGDYIHKPMQDCTGREICEEWLYHIGVPTDQIADLAANSCKTIPVMMPFASSYFMPRAKGDRPDVVPEGAENFAFLGEFAETPRDTVFTTEYAMRTGMEAVYRLFDIDRGVPEVWGSQYDIRDLLKAAVSLRDGRPLSEMHFSLPEKMALHAVLEKIEGTDIEKLLKEYHVL